MVRKMDRESTIMQMEEYIRGCGLIIKFRVMGSKKDQYSMRGSGLKEIGKERVFLEYKIALIKDNLWQESLMVLVYSKMIF